jgi:hypothetical protein
LTDYPQIEMGRYNQPLNNRLNNPGTNWRLPRLLHRRRPERRGNEPRLLKSAQLFGAALLTFLNGRGATAPPDYLPPLPNHFSMSDAGLIEYRPDAMEVHSLIKLDDG